MSKSVLVDKGDLAAILNSLRDQRDAAVARAEKAERERDEARAEVEVLKDMVAAAYNSGFTEGMREHTSRRGGIPWSDSIFKKRIGR